MHSPLLVVIIHSFKKALGFSESCRRNIVLSKFTCSVLMEFLFFNYNT